MTIVLGELQVRPTRFQELGYTCVVKNLWRVVDKETGKCIGPYYTTKTELLADLDSFCCAVRVHRSVVL